LIPVIVTFVCVATMTEGTLPTPDMSALKCLLQDRNQTRRESTQIMKPYKVSCEKEATQVKSLKYMKSWEISKFVRKFCKLVTPR